MGMRSRLTKDRRNRDVAPIACSKCGLPGGTLLKVDDHYEHQNKAKCMLLRRDK